MILLYTCMGCSDLYEPDCSSAFEPKDFCCLSCERNYLASLPQLEEVTDK